MITRLKQTHFFASQKTDSIGKKFGYNENSLTMSSFNVTFILVASGEVPHTTVVNKSNTLLVASDKMKPNNAAFKIVIF